ncbi:GNAT family N-acetyltransferase [Sphingomonas turrisvirgatae]|nr:GNAT family N-acetyltransferase [Sphingomonas turrisvirgatae]
MGEWRPMLTADLPAVTALSAAVHGVYAEPQAVYTERLTLFPAGCFTWVRDDSIDGFLVTHPWRGDEPPALGAMLGSIPRNPDRYYLHDIALAATARNTGAGRAAIALVDDLARQAGLRQVTLVAVNGADRYWAANGFSYVPGQSGSYGAGSFAMRREIG